MPQLCLVSSQTAGTLESQDAMGMQLFNQIHSICWFTLSLVTCRKYSGTVLHRSCRAIQCSPTALLTAMLRCCRQLTVHRDHWLELDSPDHQLSLELAAGQPRSVAGPLQPPHHLQRPRLPPASGGLRPQALDVPGCAGGLRSQLDCC